MRLKAIVAAMLVLAPLAVFAHSARADGGESTDGHGACRLACAAPRCGADHHARGRDGPRTVQLKRVPSFEWFGRRLSKET